MKIKFEFEVERDVSQFDYQDGFDHATTMKNRLRDIKFFIEKRQNYKVRKSKATFTETKQVTTEVEGDVSS